MRRVLVLLVAAGAAVGLSAPAGADPCCDPPCRLVWEKPTVDPETGEITVTRPQWIC